MSGRPHSVVDMSPRLSLLEPQPIAILAINLNLQVGPSFSSNSFSYSGKAPSRRPGTLTNSTFITVHPRSHEPIPLQPLPVLRPSHFPKKNNEFLTDQDPLRGYVDICKHNRRACAISGLRKADQRTHYSDQLCEAASTEGGGEVLKSARTLCSATSVDGTAVQGF
jgi:hypothetical protein